MREIQFLHRSIRIPLGLGIIIWQLIIVLMHVRKWQITTLFHSITQHLFVGEWWQSWPDSSSELWDLPWLLWLSLPPAPPPAHQCAPDEGEREREQMGENKKLFVSLNLQEMHFFETTSGCEKSAFFHVILFWWHEWLPSLAVSRESARRPNDSHLSDAWGTSLTPVMSLKHP